MLEKIKYCLTIKKAKKYIAPGKKLKDIEFWDLIIIEIIGCAASIQSNKIFKFINANETCLYDACLFIAFNIQKQNADKQKPMPKDLYINLMGCFSHTFECLKIRKKDITLSRIDFYDRIYKEKGIDGIFEEFQIILKCDIIENNFILFNENSPLYMLPGIADNFLCDTEAAIVKKYVETDKSLVIK